MADELSSAPDIGALEIPIDAWTQPFWDAAAEEKLLLPRCVDCHRFRWPPGPFCPYCQSQRTEWRAPGEARLYSFTVTRTQGEDGRLKIQAPALVEFPGADGVRILAAIVDAPLADIRIGANLKVAWSQAANAKAPIFRLA